MPNLPQKVILAEDAAILHKARFLPLELDAAFGTLEAVQVPLPLRGVQEELVRDPQPAAGAERHAARVIGALLEALLGRLRRRSHHRQLVGDERHGDRWRGPLAAPARLHPLGGRVQRPVRRLRGRSLQEEEEDSRRCHLSQSVSQSESE